MTDKLRKALSVAILTLTVAGLVCFVTAVVGQESNKSTGTGFIVDPNGYLLTCHHVVEDSGKVEVAIGGKTYEATVLASDEKRDLALLEVKAKGLTPLPLANSNQVEVGQEVRAFGFPISSLLGANVKVTRGTVSGIETKEAQKVFQIDAPVNPGNSGGPLVNEQGEVVAVVNAKLAGSVVSNVGFAVPINYAKTTLHDNGVEFATAGSKEKLDGPALVKRVSPSVVLITVTPKGAAREGEAPAEPRTPVTPPPPSRAEDMKKAQADAYAELKKKGVASPPGMVLVPAGEFETEDGSKVSLNAFWIDKTEVTNAEFQKFVKATGHPREGKAPAAPGSAVSAAAASPSPDEPVTNVTWADAAAYAKWAGKRVPSEAEWEKAARGTDRRVYPWGNDFDAAKANGDGQADGFKGASPSGTFKDGFSPWGALDMSGNVWEWCSNDFSRSVGDSSRDYKGLSKVIRGGSFASSEKGLRCGQRAALLPNLSLNELGFRCVKDEPNLAAVPGPTSPVPATTEWEGVLKFKGEAAELKCTPKFEQVTFQTSLGTLTLKKEYIQSLAPNEVQLLGGSVLKGKLQDATLPVLWSLGERQIAAAEVERYQRAIEPPVVSVGVTKDGVVVPPGFGAQLTLKDESIVVGDLQEKELRMRLVGVGETSIPTEKVVQLVAEGNRLLTVLKDGNTVQGELLGDYHLILLEGNLTLTGGERLASLSFVHRGVSGLISRINPKDGAWMVWIPTEGKTAAQGFWMYKYEVTNAQYRKFIEANPEWQSGGAKAKQLADSDYLKHLRGDDKEYASTDDKCPVAWVSWHAAKAYAEWAGCQLPTHDQWEWAARGGLTGKKYVWGDEWPPPKGAGNFADQTAKKKWNWSVIEGYDDGYAGTAPVGSFSTNGYGLHDMAGNVWEWVSEQGQLRGGSFGDGGPDFIAVSSRDSSDPQLCSSYCGFRCLRTQ